MPKRLIISLSRVVSWDAVGDSTDGLVVYNGTACSMKLYVISL